MCRYVDIDLHRDRDIDIGIGIDIHVDILFWLELIRCIDRCRQEAMSTTCGLPDARNFGVQRKMKVPRFHKKEYQ